MIPHEDMNTDFPLMPGIIRILKWVYQNESLSEGIRCFAKVALTEAKKGGSNWIEVSRIMGITSAQTAKWKVDCIAIWYEATHRLKLREEKNT